MTRHGPAGTSLSHGGPARRYEVLGVTGRRQDHHAGLPSRPSRLRPGRHRDRVRHGTGGQRPQTCGSALARRKHLAAIIDMLDDWDEVRALVAAIRQAAADITEAGMAEPAAPTTSRRTIRRPLASPAACRRAARRARRQRDRQGICLAREDRPPPDHGGG